MDLDPSVFASIGNAAVFSADGDAYGMAAVSGLHLDVPFGSGSGSVGESVDATSATKGIGAVRGLPVLVVNAAVLAAASPGTKTSIRADATQSPWNDPQGNQYSVSVVPGSLTVGGSLSVQNIAPGGGVLPAGTSVQVLGSGFTADTTVEVDEVSVAGVQFIGPQEIDLTLAAPAELTGKRFVLAHPDGTSVEYFSFLIPASVRLPANGYVPPQPIFPVLAWSGGLSATFPFEGGAFAIENPQLDPVTVTLEATFGGPAGQLTVTIPPDGLAIYDPGEFGETDIGTNFITASAPVRALAFSFCPLCCPPQCTTAGETLVQSLYPATPAPTFPPPTSTATPASLSWQWQTGSPLPPSRTIEVTVEAEFTLASSTASGGAWLSVAPNPNVPSFLVVTVNPTGLAVGTYQGSVTIDSPGSQPPALTIPVSLTVTQNQVGLLATAPASLDFHA